MGFFGGGSTGAAPGGAGADKQVIFNNAGTLAGDGGLLYDKTSGALSAFQLNLRNINSAAEIIQATATGPSAGNATGLVFLIAQNFGATQQLRFSMAAEAGDIFAALGAAGGVGTFKGFKIGAEGIPNAGAALQIDSITGGVLFPRVTTVQRNAIGAPNGTVLFNTDLQSLEVVAGGAWKGLGRDISCRLQHSNDQSVPASGSLFVTWDVEQYDTANMHDPAVNPSRITVPVAGKYWVSACINWTGFQTSGIRSMNFCKNGVGQAVASMVVTTGTTFIQQNNALIDANAGDYFELIVFQTSPAALPIYGNVSSGQQLGAPFFSAIKIG